MRTFFIILIFKINLTISPNSLKWCVFLSIFFFVFSKSFSGPPNNMKNTKAYGKYKSMHKIANRQVSSITFAKRRNEMKLYVKISTLNPYQACYYRFFHLGWEIESTLMCDVCYMWYCSFYLASQPGFHFETYLLT